MNIKTLSLKNRLNLQETRCLESRKDGRPTQQQAITTRVTARIKTIFNPTQTAKKTTKLHCPYGCNHHLDRMPTTQIKCPLCKKIIHPSRPLFSKEKRLMTREQAKRVAIERAAFDTLYRYGEIPIRELQKEWAKSTSDCYLSERAHNFLTHQIAQYQDSKDYQLLQGACHELRQLSQAQGKACTELLHTIFNAQLMSIRDSGHTAIQIHGPNKSLAGKIIPIDQALQEQLLPCRANCTCHYVPLTPAQRKAYNQTKS